MDTFVGGIMRSKVTIVDIADRAGVAKSTVSKVVNNYPGVSLATKKRVQKAIEALGFVPNEQARALAAKRSGYLGLLIPENPEQQMDQMYWSELISSVNAEAVSNNLRVVLLLPRDDETLDDFVTSVIRSKRVDGVIVATETRFGSLNYLHLFREAELPFVLLGRGKSNLDSWIDIDNERAAYQGALHLISKGAKRIGFLSGPSDYAYNQERAQGYERALKEAGVGEPIIRYCEHDDDEALHKALSFLCHEVKVDALLYGAGGNFYLKILATLKDLGIDPRGFLQLTFDDYPFLDFVANPVSSIRQPLEFLGTKAVQSVLKQINGEDSEPEQILMDVELIER